MDPAQRPARWVLALSMASKLAFNCVGSGRILRSFFRSKSEQVYGVESA